MVTTAMPKSPFMSRFQFVQPDCCPGGPTITHRRPFPSQRFTIDGPKGEGPRRTPCESRMYEA
ncbi:MAG: hypothetical protein DI618_01820 [Dermacoccus nishinomiyaensis]|uniref:Uncharacterized protein n=1 Tax=Dermacoccus nishinomiyaensis TaxID=1274 RepID=A0A075JGZ5_9MICO|nr:hypothetical protein HX89_09595 [Dermacoccus nishinomiyaensis]PZP04570.1 MAG: hypothetical protein DI618_01820 [Dermacoccus nishinomiyaensis]HCQ19213.1 hypothetical protein [Dermacoccus sp.]